eukprot:jgi/Psemu1/324074/estExt_fgenesh1_pg.C_1170005
MIGLKIWLSFAAATYSTAFVPTSIRTARSHHPLAASVDSSSKAKSTGSNWLKHLFEHEGHTPKAINDFKVQLRVDKFVARSVPILFSLHGKPKSEGLQKLQKAYIDMTLSDYTLPKDPNYQYFDNSGKNGKVLEYLLKVDPFFATALTKTKDGFELRAWDSEDPDCTNNPSLFREMACTLAGTGHRVNIYFDEKMKITGYDVYDDVVGGKVDTSSSDKDVDYWAGSALYNTLFYASSVHATIHVLHYLMTSAFQFVSEDHKSMHKWANYYANNIQIKYGQVGDRLIRPAAKPFDGDYLGRLTAAITGKLGFGSRAEDITPILTRMLNEWGENPTASAWFDYMMNVSTEDMDKAGILTEFRKHANLAKPYAKEVAEAFREINVKESAIAEHKLADYLKNCGSFSSNIDSLEDWIELMSITGSFHGGTLGYSRLGAMSEVMQWRDIKDPNWDTPGLFISVLLLGTICGMEVGDHVMTSTYHPHQIFKYDSKLQAVLDKYDKKTTAIKEEYEKKIQLDPDFSEYGWILSEFCTDGFDGKQLTTATYI